MYTKLFEHVNEMDSSKLLDLIYNEVKPDCKVVYEAFGRSTSIRDYKAEGVIKDYHYTNNDKTVVVDFWSDKEERSYDFTKNYKERMK